MTDSKTADDVNYQPVSADPEKTCQKCKNFQPKNGDEGECFGHKVSALATCNFFEQKNG